MRDVWPKPDENEAYHRITEILGCKWSLAIFDALERGLNRPSQIERDVDGLTARVLHRCLSRLEGDGILVRTVYPEIPPRVEYSLSDSGRELVGVLAAVRRLADAWPGARPTPAG